MGGYGERRGYGREEGVYGFDDGFCAEFVDYEDGAGGEAVCDASGLEVRGD